MKYVTSLCPLMFPEFICNTLRRYVCFVLQDATKAKQFLPFLQRSGKTTAIVEVRLLSLLQQCVIHTCDNHVIISIVLGGTSIM